ncbi:hypothetical protein BH09DEP1_BH09DEP1_4720 [soil metagenome]
MKYSLTILLLISLANSFYADLNSRLNQKNARYSQLMVESGKTFEIKKRCAPEQRWQLQALPESVTLCGLQITEGIWYENDLVCGGSATHDYHYTFKMNQPGPVTVTFELLNAQNQIEKTEITRIVNLREYSDYLNEWLRKERDLAIPMSEIDKMHVAGPTTFQTIDKQTLCLEIRRILYMVFFQEMAIISGNFSDMAQDNSELAQDLKDLFCVSFNQGDGIVQEKLDEFCRKWDLEKIEISE